MTASEMLRQGPQRAAGILSELTAWMSAGEYESVSQLRGSVAQHAVRRPGRLRARAVPARAGLVEALTGCR